VLQPWNNRDRFNHVKDEAVAELNADLLSRFGIDYGKYDRYDVAAVYYDWDKEAVAQLKRVLDETGAKIVLSSNWRDPVMNRMIDFFKLHGLEKYYVDDTPDLDYWDGKDQPCYKGYRYRTIEILEYLKAHPHIEGYVVVDDMAWTSGPGWTGISCGRRRRTC